MRTIRVPANSLKVELIAALEVANMLFHPGSGLLAFIEFNGIDDFALTRDLLEQVSVILLATWLVCV